MLVDIREPHEYARTHIAGSHNIALSRFTATDMPTAGKIVYLCASGTSTSVNAAALAARANGADAYVLQGGIMAWQRAGLPVERAGGGNLLAGLFRR